MTAPARTRDVLEYAKACDAERIPVAETPTVTRPDLDRDQDVKPKALLPYKVVVLDRTTRVAHHQ
jgi:hypothetical protein